MLKSKLVGLTLAFALLVPVFGVFAQDMSKMELPEIDPLDYEGDIITAGSSTVFPLTQAAAEKFNEAGFAGEITVDNIGTGAGFERFCVNGETDISNASRPIKSGEAEACAALEPARTPLEFFVAVDALSIAVSAENDFIGEEGLTIEQIGQIFASGNKLKWSDINPEWPNQAILLYSPGTDSGTFDYFVEAVMRPYAKAQGVADDQVNDAAEEFILKAGGITLSEDDNVLVSGVSESPFAIAYFGYAYYLENTDILRDLAVEGVIPSEEAVQAGEYPLARPLFIYSDATIMNEKPQVAAFIAYYLANVENFVSEVGYFPSGEKAIAAAKEAYCTAMAEAEDEALRCTEM
jgi:phosphate binding protein